MLMIGLLSWPGDVSSAIAREPVWIAAISLGCSGIGESCQFQKRVMSSFSAALRATQHRLGERPATSQRDDVLARRAADLDAALIEPLRPRWVAGDVDVFILKAR